MAPVGGKSKLLSLIGDVKAAVQDKMGNANFPMPQFILIGKQSVGKSRLVETLAGETFNFTSGTLGSRRPTVLEFKRVTDVADTRSTWYVRDAKTNAWGAHPIEEVMKIVGARHEELGATVSSEPVYVRVDSPNCVDMTIVDLPGFRDFALDAAKQKLSESIENLVTGFMADERNVMLCVEQAGDAATMSSLQKCRAYDPSLRRTILIRNKLDKYYKDLTPDNVTAWIDGHGDLPSSLVRFAVSLPHWTDGVEPPKAAQFPKLIQECDERDTKALKERGLAAKYMPSIGFMHFSNYMETKIEQMFSEAIGPVMETMLDMQRRLDTERKDLVHEMDLANPDKLLATIRDCGSSFSSALGNVMDGVLHCKPAWTLEEEWRIFHAKNEDNHNFCKLPSPDMAGMSDYMEYLTEEADMAAAEVELNGGAQFRRVVTEIEIFMRFSEIAVNTKKRDVIQARGISMGTLTWRDVIVKLLASEAHHPLQMRINYVAERIKHFFESQKEVVLNFMHGLETSAMAKMYGPMLPKHGKLIANNEMIKMLLFTTYDAAVKRQYISFLDLYENMLTSTFSNPWVFLKGATTDSCLTGGSAGTIEEFKAKIPELIQSRSDSEVVLAKWLSNIPQDSVMMDEAIDKVQMLVLKTYGFIRAQVCDNLETFAESFFKLPMLRMLESDMSAMTMSDRDSMAFEARKEILQEKVAEKTEQLKELDKWIQKVQEFVLGG